MRRFNPASVIALAIVLAAIVSVYVASADRSGSEVVAIVGAVGALVLSLLPAISRFSGRA